MSSLQQQAQAVATTTDLITRYGDQFATVLPTHLKREQFVRLAIGALRRNPQLKQVADRNPASMMQALLECARLGHEPGTEAFYLVPFGNEVQGIEGYRGVVERMYRGGKVSAVKAEIVYENDHFEFHPGMDFPDHRPVYFGDRGEIIGAYSYARFTDGTYSRVTVIDKPYIDRVKAESRGSNSKSSPWVKWYDAMVLKTAAKRLEPWVPTSTEWIRDQYRAVAEVQAEHRQDAPAITPVPEPRPQIGHAPEEPVDAEVVDTEHGHVDPATGAVIDHTTHEEPPADVWPQEEAAQ